jgi:GH25 family lysozyme M1 (1,4-beta-N-acetylmuramidase)
MTDTATRAPWLEAHSEFEGVGAHELNGRYEHVDGDPASWDTALRASAEATLAVTPALRRAQGLLSAAMLTTTPRLDGPDVAHYQVDGHPIDWAAVKAARCDWAACKLTQSIGYLDPTAAGSRQAMAAQRFRHRGLYHWLSSTTDPEHQAAWFLSRLGVLEVGEFVMLDDEEAGVDVDRTLAWLGPVEHALHRPCTVYSGAFVAGGTIWTDPRIREGEYGRRPTALAAYTTEAKARALPGVAQHPWSSWQFSSNGPVPGVTGRCDMNRCDDTAIFDLAAGITHSTVTEATTATVQEDTVMYISNSETRTATSSDPGHAWFELMPGGRLRIVTDINDVKVALGTDVPETVTSVQRKNSWIDGLLAKGAWTEPVAAPAAPVLSGRIELTGTLS